MKKTIYLNYISLSLLIVIVILLIYQSYAWFEKEKDVNLTNEDNCLIMSSANLEISVDGINYYNDINLDVTDSLVDVTSNGIDFYYPENLNEEDDVDILDYDNLRLISNGDLDYSNYVKEVEISFRTTEKMNVYLNDNSFVLAKEAINSINPDRPSLYSGNNVFTQDGIAGAVRVCFLEEMDEYTIVTNLSRVFKINVSHGETITNFYRRKDKCYVNISDDQVFQLNIDDYEEIDEYFKSKTYYEIKCLWIPNDHYELSYNNTIASFNQNGQRETFRGRNTLPYGYLTKENSQIVEEIYEESDYANYITVGNNLLSSNANGFMINDSIKLLEFNNSNKLVTKKIIVRIWFEGTDRECDKALGNGQIKYQLSFTGINKNNNCYFYNRNDIVELGDNEDILYYTNGHFQSFNGNVNYASDGNMNLQFSYNGIDIFDYNPNYDFSIKNYVYVRIKETEDTLPSNFVRVSINE